MLAELAHTQFGLLHLVDLVVDGFQTRVVLRAEILTACSLGNTAQGGLVELVVHRDILFADGCLHRYAGLTVTAYTDRIDADAVGLRDLGRCLRVDITAVVTSVGQQDNHFRFRLAVFHAVYRVRQTQTDSRTVFYHTVFHRLEEVNEHRVVGRQRTLCKTLSGKDNQTDLIIRTGDYEVRSHFLGGLQTVRAQVLG